MNESTTPPPPASRQLAEFVVDALVQAGLVDEADFARTVEIAEEEIRVRAALGDLEFK